MIQLPNRLLQNYLGIPNLLEHRVGVLLVDMQEGFMSRLYGFEKRALVKEQRQILTYCAINDIPVAVLEYRGRGATISTLQQVLKEVPRTKIIPKNEKDGFSNPQLARRLHYWGLTRLCITGIFGPLCIIETAKGALRNGFSVFSTDGLIGNHMEDSSTEALDLFDNEYGFYFGSLDGFEDASLQHLDPVKLIKRVTSLYCSFQPLNGRRTYTTP